MLNYVTGELGMGCDKMPTPSFMDEIKFDGNRFPMFSLVSESSSLMFSSIDYSCFKSRVHGEG